jgi:hypothetical protein
LLSQAVVVEAAGAAAEEEALEEFCLEVLRFQTLGHTRRLLGLVAPEQVQAQQGKALAETTVPSTPLLRPAGEVVERQLFRTLLQ